jgi:hypothetical protein
MRANLVPLITQTDSLSVTPSGLHPRVSRDKYRDYSRGTDPRQHQALPDR